MRTFLIILSIMFAAVTNSPCNAQGSSNVTLLANVNDYAAYGYSDCWGYTAPDGREYALLCVRHGISIVDITENNNIREVAFIAKDSKDIKTYQHYAYGVNENTEDYGMVIIDLSNLPNSATLVSQYTGFRRSHNLFIDEDNALLYAQNRNNTTQNDAVRVLSLADPLNPVGIAQFDNIGCHDIYARGNVAYVSEAVNGSIGIYDLSIPSSPAFVQRINIPAGGFSHNAWLSGDGNYLITTEENRGSTVKLWDIRDLGDVAITDTYLGPDGIAHNATLKGKYAYIAHYTDGLRIVDISNPSNIAEAAFYDTYPQPSSGQFAGAWGVFPFFSSGKVLISDIQTGLYVFFFEGASGLSEFVPKSPGNVSAYSDFKTPNSILLKWTDPQTYVNGTALTDFTVEIHRDGQFLTSVASGNETYTDMGLTDGQKYLYTLYARDANDSLSVGNNVSAFAGGAPTPMPPVDAFFSKNRDGDLLLNWRNPNKNFDGTPMDDFAGVKLYENDQLIQIFERAPNDTSRADSTIITQPENSTAFHLTAFDNESPSNESEPGDAVYSPQSLPFKDTFENQDAFDPDFWTTINAEINRFASLPPSPILALHLDAWPDGGDLAESVPFDLETKRDSQVVVSFYYQPQGLRGPNTTNRDTLIVEFANNFSQWIRVRDFAGSGLRAFRKIEVFLTDENPGSGASFFHSRFKIRFRSKSNFFATAGDFFVDDVSVVVDDSPVGVNDELTTPPPDFALFQNYPNPFNPETTIHYNLPQDEFVLLKIYDLLGREVRTLINAKQSAGKKRISWDGRDDAGKRVSSGMYLYKLKAGGYVAAKKMVLLQ